MDVLVQLYDVPTPREGCRQHVMGAGTEESVASVVHVTWNTTYKTGTQLSYPPMLYTMSTARIHAYRVMVNNPGNVVLQYYRDSDTLRIWAW